MKFGAIDIGTNAARLLIGEVVTQDGHSFVKKISYTRLPLRLGIEVFETGKISKKKSTEFVKTIKAFKLITEIFGVKKIRAVATSAMREATNADRVIDRIYEETEVLIEVISGQEEAELIFGTFFLLDIDRTAPFLVIDVGGGSTEISVFEEGRKVASKSFEVGTLRMLKDKVSPALWTDIHDWISKHVDMSSPHTIFGTGGNINKVHKLLGAAHMDPIQLNDMERLLSSMKSLTVDQRVDQFQLKPDRADVIEPALEIYLYIMKELGVQELIVPKIGLSDGVIYDLHQRSKGKVSSQKVYINT